MLGSVTEPQLEGKSYAETLKSKFKNVDKDHGISNAEVKPKESTDTPRSATKDFEFDLSSSESNESFEKIEQNDCMLEEQLVSEKTAEVADNISSKCSYSGLKVDPQSIMKNNVFGIQNVAVPLTSTLTRLHEIYCGKDTDKSNEIHPKTSLCDVNLGNCLSHDSGSEEDVSLSGNECVDDDLDSSDSNPSIGIKNPKIMCGKVSLCESEHLPSIVINYRMDNRSDKEGGAESSYPCDIRSFFKGNEAEKNDDDVLASFERIPSLESEDESDSDCSENGHQVECQIIEDEPQVETPVIKFDENCWISESEGDEKAEAGEDKEDGLVSDEETNASVNGEDGDTESSNESETEMCPLLSPVRVKSPIVPFKIIYDKSLSMDKLCNFTSQLRCVKTSNNLAKILGSKQDDLELTSCGQKISHSAKYRFPRRFPVDIDDLADIWETDFEVGDKIFPKMSSWEEKGISPSLKHNPSDYKIYSIYKKLYQKWTDCNKCFDIWRRKYRLMSLSQVLNYKPRVIKYYPKMQSNNNVQEEKGKNIPHKKKCDTYVKKSFSSSNTNDESSATGREF